MKALQENLPLSAWTTFGVGGPARYFLDATAEDDVREGLDFAKGKNLPVFVLGGGSNLLIADRGFPGLVLRIGLKGMVWEDERVTVASGEDWDGVVGACVERNLAGIECLSGIPGLAGGTPVQNVGAYGQEVAEVLVSVRAFDRNNGSIEELRHAQCGFGYRASIFNTSQRERYIILSVNYALHKDGAPKIVYPDLVRRLEKHPRTPTLADVRREVRQIRAGKGMLIVDGDPDCRSAGSFFKNPLLTETEFSDLQNRVPEPVPRYPAATEKVKTSAAWLIERAGFGKGFAIGPAAISTRHTLALVNRGGATAEDLLHLARTICLAVQDRFGVRLVPEPVFVGFDGGESI